MKSFHFSLVSKKRSLKQRTFAAFIRDTILNHFSAYDFFNLVSRYLSTIALFPQEQISSILFCFLS